MKPLLLGVLATAALAVSAPVLAQDHSGHAMPPVDPHAGHDMHGAHGAMPAPEPTPTDPHAGHAMHGAMPPAASSPTPPPTDHAADALFDPAELARARKALRREHGAFGGAMILFDLAEYQARKGGDGYRWEGEAWLGGDIDRLLIKSEGEGTFGEAPESVEAQLLYSRAVAPYWNAHVGVRRDFRPDPSRTHAVVGIEGTAPYWFHLSGQVFLSSKGEARARAEGSYDQRITQGLILTPRAEFNLSAQDIRAIGLGSGLTDVELGLRLRYELRKEFAPYVGVEWSRLVGSTARHARAAGEDVGATNVVAGIRFWM